MHWILIYFYVFDVSFVLALLLTPVFQRLSFTLKFLDEPDKERKIHAEPMPLLGGFAVFGAFATNILLNYFIVMPLVSRCAPGDLSIHVPGAFSVWAKLLVCSAAGRRWCCSARWTIRRI